MTLNYLFEGKRFGYDITSEDIFDFIDGRQTEEIASYFTAATRSLSDDEISSIKDELGINGSRTISSFVKSNRATAVSYFVSHPELFRTTLTDAFKRIAKEEFGYVMIRSILY